MNKQLATAKNFVHRHKTAIAVAATVVVCYKMQRNIVNGWDEFLKEHDLFETYYNPME